MKFLGICLFAIFAFSFVSCSDDDDPADNDFFIGSYTGSIGFNDTANEDLPIASTDGQVTVVKIGDKYNFDFSNGIPSVTGIEFRKDGDNSWINVDGTDISYIRINAKKLTMFYNKGTRTWTANVERK
ncbi:hypothetical protein ACF3NR_10685 [Vaginella massiliensis]|uniref:hypothetical protein n=1 Tax=Vaginella massiliensis TaxID=1816680 RepID=UPI0037538353